MSYPAIIQRRIFDRIGMRSSAAVIDDRIRARLPVSYSRWPHTGDYVEEPWFECSAADGSIVSTAEDMAAYARVILNRGAAPQGRLLSDRAEPERRSRRLKPERLRTTRLKQLSHSESW